MLPNCSDIICKVDKGSACVTSITVHGIGTGLLPSIANIVNSNQELNDYIGIEWYLIVIAWIYGWWWKMQFNTYIDAYLSLYCYIP